MSYVKLIFFTFFLYLYSDDPPARRRRNHCMVEEGVHVVPTLRNRVVIFDLYLLYIK